MHRRALFHCLLTLLLLFGQIGAQAHAVSHLAQPSSSDSQNLPDTPCDKCVVFAKLGAALGSAPPLLPVAQACFSVVVAPVEAVVSRFCLSYRSRAPPSRG